MFITLIPPFLIKSTKISNKLTFEVETISFGVNVAADMKNPNSFI